ncbi:MAG: hypothetical protein GY934_00950 [Gammaproteobacteria bacterium]|nr:hypothetical protein [Gammaproteobacteria bacterium]
MRLRIIIHRTDNMQEWAYDRKSHVEKLDKALDLASKNGWIVVNMQREWQQTYPE